MHLFYFLPILLSVISLAIAEVEPTFDTHLISEELLKDKNLFGYDLKCTVIPGSNSDVMVLFHGYGGDYRIGEKLKSYGTIQDTLISFNFPDSGIIQNETDPINTSYGSIDELLPALFVLKKCIIDSGLEKISLYGFSAGGGAVINVIGALNSSRFDQDLKRIGIMEKDKAQILSAIQKGTLVLDAPLKSVEEIIANKTLPNLEPIAKRFEENNLRPIDSLSLLEHSPLNIIVHFQEGDAVLSNRDDALYIERLKKYNEGKTFVIGGSNEGHSAYHASLWEFYNQKILEPTLVVSSDTSLADEKITIAIKGLSPHAEVQLKAEMQDDEGVTWTSHALFKANEIGTVKLEKDSSLDGTYKGIDPMGIFWSMGTSSPAAKSFSVASDRMTVKLSVFEKERVIATKDVVRLKMLPDIEKIDVKENGLRGTLFLPASDKPLPVVITLSGSNGGLSEGRAKLLSSHGFAVLALGYFGIEGLPPNLENIPIEYFEKSFNWLKNHPSIDPDHIGIYGASRGAELALILGTLFPDSIQAIVATVPSSVSYAGPGKKTPAWTFHGKPVGTYLTVPQAYAEKKQGKDPHFPITTTTHFLNGMKDKKAFNQALIPVEKIKSPLLIISGGDDRMWPSSIFAKQIKERLKEKGSKIPCIHLDYPKAGHQINIPYLPASSLYYNPIGKLWFAMGGTPQEDDLASRDSWEKLVAFFQTHLASDER